MVNLVSSFSAGTITGTSTGDIIVGVGDASGAGRVIDAAGGNDVVLAGAPGLLSRAGPGGDSFATALDITSDPSLWSTLPNPDIGNPGVPHTTVLAAGFGAAHFYQVRVGAGETLTLDVDYAQSSQGGGTGFDASLAVFDSAQALVAEGGDSASEQGGEGSRFGLTPPARSTDPYLVLTNSSASAQTYFIRVGNEATGGGVPIGGVYTLNVSLTGQATAAMPAPGDDNVSGGDGFDVLHTLGGNDTLDGGADNDSLRAGPGDDLILYRNGDGADIIDGGPGDDTLRILAENPGGDTVLPLGAGRMELVETIEITGPGSVRITLAPSQADDIRFDASAHTGGRVTLFFEMGADTRVDASALDLVGFSDSADVIDIIGDSDDEDMTGNAMANYIDGGAGDDTIQGGGGNDRIVPGTGVNIAEGGAGRDTLSYSEQAEDVLVDLGAGTARLLGETSAVSGFEAVETGAGDDRLAGDGAAKTLLRAGAGDDGLYGDGVQLAVTLGLTGQIYRLYQATLDRAPDIAGAQGWVAQRVEGRVALDGVAGRFVASREFQATYGALDDIGFVELLYQNVLGRAADAGGLATWTGLLADGAPRAEVVLGFSESREFIAATRSDATAWAQASTQGLWSDDVYRLYQATLDRPPDLLGFLDWTERLGSGTSYLSAVEGFTGSPEFVTTYGALSDADFVDLLYNNVLDRDADEAGLASWLDRIAEGFSRAQVVQGFAQSQELINRSVEPILDWIQAQGIDDQLVGGAGNNVLTGGVLSDIFVFAQADGGTHTVLDLEIWDLLDFNGFGYASPAQARAQLTQAGADVVFADQGVSVTFTGTTLDAFADGMFI